MKNKCTYNLLWMLNRINTLKENAVKTEDESIHATKLWLKNSLIPNEGFSVSTGQKISYPEVTGYLIPTLYNIGDCEFARELAKWLVSVQSDSGSFCAPDGTPYTFDTGQVLRGLLTVLNDMPRVKMNIVKACDWLLTQIMPNGEIVTPSTNLWELPNGKKVDNSIHLYILPPLVEAGRRLNKQEYIIASNKAIDYYKNNRNLTSFNTLSHFFGYVMEALCDLGEKELTKKGMIEIENLQKVNGSIPAYNNVDWICAPGTAQLSIVWYKLGNRERADAALRYMKSIQNKSGGFYGSYGKGANYFPKEEIPWAAKYFLDACQWHQRFQ